MSAELDDQKETETPLDRGDELVPPAAEEAPVTDKLDEGDETPEERAEREKAEAEEAKKRNIRIPKARFDEAQAKARAREQALVEEIERLKGGQQANETRSAVADMRGRIDELQDKYEDLILDGQKDEARKVRKQIEAMRDDLLEYQTSVKSDEARKSAIDTLSYNAQLANLEAQYPELNPDNDRFDEERTSEVATLLNAFVNSGVARAAALSKAVRYVFGAPAEHQRGSTADDRARGAREKAAQANTRQPPNLNKVGTDSDRMGSRGGSDFDVMRMSQDKFAKLDEETKAKLRGDEL